MAGKILILIFSSVFYKGIFKLFGNSSKLNWQRPFLIILFVKKCPPWNTFIKGRCTNFLFFVPGKFWVLYSHPLIFLSMRLVSCAQGLNTSVISSFTNRFMKVRIRHCEKDCESVHEFISVPLSRSRNTFQFTWFSASEFSNI